MIEIRDAADFNGTGYSTYGHIPNARSIDILQLESSIEDLQSFKEEEIVTMCPGGGLSLAAVEIITEAGFTDVKRAREILVITTVSRARTPSALNYRSVFPIKVLRPSSVTTQGPRHR